MISAFFSNRVEQLLEFLKESLFANSAPFSRRIVVVPSPVMKSWIQWQMANDPQLEISMGIEFCYLNEAISKLMLIYGTHEKYFPSKVELALSIDWEIRQVLEEREQMTEEECSLWEPLFKYLSTKNRERRVYALSTRLATLFQNYETFGSDMLREWDEVRMRHWQQELRFRLYLKNPLFGKFYKEFYQIDFLKKSIGEIQIHLFALSFIPKSQFDFFSTIEKSTPIYTYIHSPCQAFWSDLASGYWEEEDRNSLLVNLGKIGREMAKAVEERPSNIQTKYMISSSLLEYEPYRELINEEIFVERDERNTTLLRALQADLLLLRTPKTDEKISISPKDRSIQVHAAGSKMREIEILHNNLLEIMEKHRQDDCPICPNDIFVMAPDISKYEGFIKAVFLHKARGVDVQIFDIEAASRNSLTQGYLYLLELGAGRWETDKIRRFFEFPEVRRKFDISTNDLLFLETLVEEGGIRWGFDLSHKKRCLSEEVMDEIGTWKFGLRRALLGLAAQLDGRIEESHSFDAVVGGIPIESFTIEMVGKWVQILECLYRDLLPISENQSMSLALWVDTLIALLEGYFVSNHEDVKAIIEKLRDQILGLHIQQKTYSWPSIQGHLNEILQKESVVYRETHAQAVKFCSMLPMRAIPAKVVYLIGMNEEDFPKKNPHDPFDLMPHRQNIDYCPTPTDYDRYLFLEAILSARNYLIMSYSEADNTEIKQSTIPSLPVLELFGYLDEYYEIDGKKISHLQWHKHPFYSFDPQYFYKNTQLKNYCERDYQTSLAYVQKQCPVRDQINNWEIRDTGQDKEIIIDIKDLTQFAKNPLKYFFNHTLGIYLENEEKASESDEFRLSHLEKYKIGKSAHFHEMTKTVSLHQKMGKMPSGMFRKIIEKKLTEQDKEYKDSLNTFQVKIEDFMSVHFELDVETPNPSQQNVWKVPSIQFALDEKNVRLVGKLDQITTDGLWIHAKTTTEDCCKYWPQILLVNFLNGITEKQAIMTKSSSAVSIDIPGADNLLKNFVRLFLFSRCNAPLILPEWVEILLKNDVSEFKEKAKQSLSDSYRFMYNPYPKHFFEKFDLDCVPSETVVKWRNFASEAFGMIPDLLKRRYDQKI